MTDTGPLTWGYAVTAFGFAATFVIGPLVVLKVGDWISRRVDQRIDRAVTDALTPSNVVPLRRAQ